MIPEILLSVAGSVCSIEFASYLAAKFCRKKFQWMIMDGVDNFPSMDRKALQEKYFGKGFDAELGWVRYPETSGNDGVFRSENGIWGYKKTTWTINKRGSRTNPGFENLDDGIISCYGDSFTFSRQVNNNETWAHFLSEKTNANVLNFGVGNYGLDQALLRLEREFPKNKTKTVIMGIVPDTMSRILSCWKQFYEYGNTWAFKPRFVLEKNELKLLPNLINSEEKFSEYEKYLEELKKNDFFYETKFKKDILKFPYSISILKNPERNINLILDVAKQSLYSHFSERYMAAKPEDWGAMQRIRKINLNWTVNLYKNPQATSLLNALLDRFYVDSKNLGFNPVFVFLPQKNEAEYFAKNGGFYMPFFKNISKKIKTIDLTTPMINHPDISSLYSEKTEYGAHYSKKGNQLVSETIYQELKKLKLV